MQYINNNIYICILQKTIIKNVIYKQQLLYLYYINNNLSNCNI